MKQIKTYLLKDVSIAPLVTFRIVFGLMMAGSMLRFWLKGWIYDLYIAPKHFFTYYGFEWVKPLSEVGMYGVFLVLFVSALLVAFGAFYRWSSAIFFFAFTYVELIDKTTYLNHYYFISIVAALMIFLPAHRSFSIDALRSPQKQLDKIPAWMLLAVRMQLGIVYFYAGIAKLNYDWLVRAMPLKLWLPANASLPIIGGLLKYTWVAYAFSWFGALYDLLIPFFLAMKRFRTLAYIAVVVFHVLTGWLFQIGMFPYIMILATLVFFSDEFHIRLQGGLKNVLNYPANVVLNHPVKRSKLASQLLMSVLAVHFLFQFVFPFRYVAYEGNRFWHEQGFRFGWRVMLIEKAGSAFFTAYLPGSSKKMAINNADYLTPNQEKMMSTQPDMILQYAHIIQEDLRSNGYENVEVKVDSYVTLNGSGSRPFINPNTNLASQVDTWENKTWIMPFEQ